MPSGSDYPFSPDVFIFLITKVKRYIVETVSWMLKHSMFNVNNRALIEDTVDHTEF